MNVSIAGTPLCARSTLAGVLAFPVSSVLILPSTCSYSALVVVGTMNGEVHFMPCKKSGSNTVKLDQKTSAPVTALASGALTGTSSGPEVIAISADGLLQCVLPPVNNAAIQIFSQTIQSNIAAAYVMDVDRDGQQELIVIMTDRVVRSFRWNQSESRLQPVNKWEVPNQISAFSIGESISTLRGAETWLSQLGARFYVCLPFSGKDAVTVTYPDTKEHTVMMMPYRSHFIHIMGTLISNIVIIANQKERVLLNSGWDVVAATTVRLSSFNVVATLDLSGLVLIYGYNERNIKDTEIAPLLRFQSMPNSDKLSASVSEDYLLLAVIDVTNRVVVYSVSVKTIKNVLNR